MPRIVRRKPRTRITRRERDETTCPLYGVSPSLLAETFSMEVGLATQWKAHLRISPHRARTIQLLVDRDLGAFDVRWDGFRVVEDALYTPEGYPVGAAEIRAVPFFHAQLNAERAALRASERRVAALLAEPCDAEMRAQVTGLLQMAIEALRQR